MAARNTVVPTGTVTGFANEPDDSPAGHLDPQNFRGLYFASNPEASIPRESINADAWRAIGIAVEETVLPTARARDREVNAMFPTFNGAFYSLNYFQPMRVYASAECAGARESLMMASQGPSGSRAKADG